MLTWYPVPFRLQELLKFNLVKLLYLNSLLCCLLQLIVERKQLTNNSRATCVWALFYVRNISYSFCFSLNHIFLIWAVHFSYIFLIWAVQHLLHWLYCTDTLFLPGTGPLQVDVSLNCVFQLCFFNYEHRAFFSQKYFPLPRLFRYVAILDRAIAFLDIVGARRNWEFHNKSWTLSHPSPPFIVAIHRDSGDQADSDSWSKLPYLASTTTLSLKCLYRL